MLTDVLGKKKNILLTEEIWEKNKMEGRGKVGGRN